MSVLIGYESMQDTAGTTVTSNVAATTHPASLAVDWLPFDYYQPDAAGASIQLVFYNANVHTCDYIAIAKHTLGTLGARVTVEYSADGVTYATALSATAVTDDSVFFKSFPAQSDKYWRVTFDRVDAATIQPTVGMLLIGAVMDMADGAQRGFSPVLIDEDSGNASISMTGQWLGKSVRRKSSKLDISFRHLTQAFVRDEWLTFMRHAQSKAFVVSWNESDYPGEAVLAWVEKTMAPPRYSSGHDNSGPLMDVKLNARAVLV